MVVLCARRATEAETASIAITSEDPGALRRQLTSSPATSRTEALRPIPYPNPLQSPAQPATTLPTTHATFPNPTPQRASDSCHPSGKALPGAAPFSREAG
jgi:hypothetical protein